MSALTAAYSTGYAGRLYWCGMQATPSPEVRTLLEIAVNAGREAFYIPSQGFDDLMERIALRLLADADLQSAKEILVAVSKVQSRKGKFLSHAEAASSLAKSNAYPLTTPSEITKVDLTFPDQSRPRAWLDTQMKDVVGAWVTNSSGAFFLASISTIRSSLAQN